MPTRQDLRRQAAIGPTPSEVRVNELTQANATLNAALETAHAAESIEDARSAIETVRPDLASIE